VTEADGRQEVSLPGGVLRREMDGFAAIISFGGANAENNL
jgi:hypothetical protein